MEDILRLRHEAARLLDFKSFAEYALADRMAHTVRGGRRRSCASWPRRPAPAPWRSSPNSRPSPGAPLEAWDITYYSERLQQSRFQVSQEELREYLPLPRVLEGLFEVAERLYGVRMQERSGVPVWHPRRALLRGAIAGRRRRWPASTWTPTRVPTSAAAPGWTTASDACSSRAQLTLPVAYLICNSLPPAGRPAGTADAR